MQVLSSNGLEISLDVSVLYQPVYDELGLLHKTKGENYVNIVLIPQIRAVARSVVGRYTPEQLYSTKRDAIQTEIFGKTMSIPDEIMIKWFNLLSMKTPAEVSKLEKKLEDGSNPRDITVSYTHLTLPTNREV